MTYRNRQLLDLAHEAPCCARFPHQCNGPTVPAHGNEQRHGRGHGHKCDDNLFAAVCPEAHDFIDGRKGGWNRETKQFEWTRAYFETQRWLWTNGKVKVA